MMNRTLNKSKWPYMLLLLGSMIAASIKPDSSQIESTEEPLMVTVQTERVDESLIPFTNWLVERKSIEAAP